MMMLLLSIATALSASLTVDQAQERAWRASADRVAFEAEARAADGQRFSPKEPEFRPSFDDVGSRTESMQTNLRLRVPIAAPGSLHNARKASVQGSEVAELEAVEERRLVALETAIAFDEARLAQLVLSRLEEQSALRDRHQVVLQARLTQGLPEHDDLMKAELDRLAWSRRLAEARFEVVSTRAALSELVQEDVADWELLGDDLEALAHQPVGTAAALDVTLEQARVREAQLLVSTMKAERYQVLEWLQADVSLEADRGPRFGVGASFPLPLYRAFRPADAEPGEELRRRNEELALATTRIVIQATVATRRLAASLATYDATREALQRSRATFEAHRSKLSSTDAIRFELELAEEDQRLLESLADVLEQRRWAEAMGPSTVPM